MWIMLVHTNRDIQQGKNYVKYCTLQALHQPEDNQERPVGSKASIHVKEILA
jgi:hypothetical protein